MDNFQVTRGVNVNDIKGLEKLTKHIEGMSEDKLLELYELTLQQEEDDSDFYYTLFDDEDEV